MYFCSSKHPRYIIVYPNAYSYRNVGLFYDNFPEHGMNKCCERFLSSQSAAPRGFIMLFIKLNIQWLNSEILSASQ